MSVMKKLSYIQEKKKKKAALGSLIGKNSVTKTRP